MIADVRALLYDELIEEHVLDVGHEGAVRENVVPELTGKPRLKINDLRVFDSLSDKTC